MPLSGEKIPSLSATTCFSEIDKCMCVRERKGDRERERGGEGERERAFGFGVWGWGLELRIWGASNAPFGREKPLLLINHLLWWLGSGVGVRNFGVRV
jgi:hypothetical protein